MSATAFTADGLWHCLCPSFNRLLVKRIPVVSNSQQSRLRRPRAAVSSAFSSQCRPYSEQRGDTHTSQPRLRSHEDQSGKKFNQWAPTSLGPGHGQAATNRSEPAAKPQRKNTKSAGKKKRESKKELSKDLEERTTSNLENILQDHVEVSPSVGDTGRILQVLLRDRQIRPQVRHYRALILANTDAQRGSPVQVRKLLQEMEQNGVPTDSGTLHAALKTLAIHPDHLLRQEILHTIRDRWLTLSPSGWHNVIAGLIREQQYELALENLAGVEARGIPVQPWLHALLVYNLCEAEEFNEVLQLIRSRVDQGHELSPNLWYHVLDTASEALHYDTTLYIWKERVEPRFINPSHGTCNNVLLLAARIGDTVLGNSVFQLLAERGTPFTLNEYETLIDIYVAAGDIETAFKILCMIQKTRLEPDDTSTRSMSAYMMHTEADPGKAWKRLKRLQKEENRDIPLAAANLVIEQSVYQHRMDDAMSFYKELHTLCPVGANVTTFNHLISGCRKTKRKDISMFLVQEMVTLGVMPDLTTYEHLVLFCIETVNFESAYMYFTDLTERGWSLGERARTDIQTKCYDSDDKFAKLLQHNPAIRKPFKINRKIGISPEEEEKVEKRGGGKSTRGS